MAPNLVEIKYVGITPAVEVDLDGFGFSTVVLNDTVSVAPEVAVLLLKQPGNWVKATAPVEVTPTPMKQKEVSFVAPLQPEVTK